MESALIGKLLRLARETAVMMKSEDGGSYLASLPSGAIVTVDRADGLSPTMLVARCRYKEFIIFERDLWDAIPVAEAQDDVFVMLKRAAG